MVTWKERNNNNYNNNYNNERKTSWNHEEEEKQKQKKHSFVQFTNNLFIKRNFKKYKKKIYKYKIMINSSAKFVKIVFRLLCSDYVFLVRNYLSTFSDNTTEKTKTNKQISR